jgi:hypothetical protein
MDAIDKHDPQLGKTTGSELGNDDGSSPAGPPAGGLTRHSATSASLAKARFGIGIAPLAGEAIARQIREGMRQVLGADAIARLRSVTPSVFYLNLPPLPQISVARGSLLPSLPTIDS